MKQREKKQDPAVETLHPEYAILCAKVASLGVVRNDQDFHFGKVKHHSSEEETAKLCWYTDAYESREVGMAKKSENEYHRKLICVSLVDETVEAFDACEVEVEEIKTECPFEFEGVLRMLPRVKTCCNPFVMSLADALEMYHKFGFIKAEISDIFIGSFSFKDINAENFTGPEAQKHYGVGLCYMISVNVDGIPCVAAICAFNEIMPKTVICHPLSDSVIRRYGLTNVFRTVCGRMTLINGVMTRT